MARGQVAYTAADATRANFGLGVGLDSEKAVNTLATGVLPRLTTVVANAIGADERFNTKNSPVEVIVVGLEAADQLVSVVLVEQVGGVGNPDGTLEVVGTVNISLEDVTAHATVAYELLTFADYRFGPNDCLIITYADVTSPAATEL